jgi:hypothetical protein
VVAGLGGLSSVPALAIPPNATDVQKTTYMLGVKCYVANGVAVSDKRYNPDGSKTAAFRDKASRSYNVIYNVGSTVSYPKALIDEDVESFQRMMPAAFLKDDAYFQRTRAECIKVGLM